MDRLDFLNACLTLITKVRRLEINCSQESRNMEQYEELVLDYCCITSILCKGFIELRSYKRISKSIINLWVNSHGENLFQTVYLNTPMTIMRLTSFLEGAMGYFWFTVKPFSEGLIRFSRGVCNQRKNLNNSKDSGKWKWL